MKHLLSPRAVKLRPSCQHCSFASFCLSHATGAMPLAKQRLSLHRGELLCRAGNVLEDLYIVESGLLTAFTLSEQGDEHITHFYLPGEAIGFEALNTGFYSDFVRAERDTVLCQLPFETVLDTVQEHRHLQKQLLKLVARHFQRTIFNAQLSAENKLMQFFVELTERLHLADKSREFTLPMTRQHIGNYLGLAPETISRLLARLKHKRWIEMTGKKLKLLQRSTGQGFPS